MNDHREKAREHERAKAESEERSGADGFMSQWAHGVNASRERLAAEIEENDGRYEFPGLYDVESGERVRAKLIDGRYGPCWAICDEAGEFTGKFVGAFPEKEETLERKGYEERTELAPAKAVLRGENKVNVRAVAVRTDGGYPDDAIDDPHQ